MSRTLTHRMRLLGSLSLAALATGLQAQVIDDVELRREGANLVMTVRMVQPVQFRRSVNSATDDLLQVYYDVVPGRERPSFLDGERKQVGGNGLPRISITEDGGARGELTDRKLVIRLDKPTKARARAGRDNRSLEVLFEGLGAAFSASAKVQPAAAAATPAPATALDAQVEARAAELLQNARQALSRNQVDLAIENLNEALNLPPNTRTREAQAAIGQARLVRGDIEGARREMTLFLQLYPDSPQAEGIRVTLAGLGTPGAGSGETTTAEGARQVLAEATARKAAGISTLTGSFSQYYYGGNSKTLTQLKDTPLEGQIPQIISESTLAGTDQKQLLTAVDLNWRSRDVDRDLRFAFRDSYTVDAMPGRKNVHRPTALYLDWKEFASGLSTRIGRQSGLGGGVLGRFDGIQAGWAFQPKWKLNVVGGRPTDHLLDTKRWFAGSSIDADALATNLAGSAYLIEQRIDGQIDRRAAGLDLRYFEPGASVFSQFEYDVALKGLNVAAVQGTYTLADNTTFNLLLDHRAAPMMMLGNALFFADPTLPQMPRTMTELLGLRPLALLREQVVSTTAYSNQGLIGATTPLNPHWQVGADLRLTSIGAIAPVPDILPNGLPATGNIWSAGLQGIGTNLYSERDTHVFNLTALRGPDYSGWLASYNNLSVIADGLQLEPSIRYYSQTGPSGLDTRRWTPGTRLTWRGGEKWVLESELNVELSHTTGTSQNEHATRLYYTLGYRLEL